MLYVFHVETGNMMTLDMSLTTETVQTLKEYVEQILKIPADKQVLLISGGECLESTKRVCSYSAGTDTNPIYLFSMYRDNSLCSQVLDFREEEELLEKEKKYSELTPSFQTVNKRAQLAQLFSDSAKNLLRICEQLILDQHNQHQGWAAVMANFEDVIAEFQCQFKHLQCDFKEYLQEREYFMQFLEKFKQDSKILHKIPVLPKLLMTHDKTKYLMETSQTSEGPSQFIFEETKEPNITLFDWIGRDEHDNDIEAICEKCAVGLDIYNCDRFNEIVVEVEGVMDKADQPKLKQIRGLGIRLYSLDKILRDTKKKVQEQNDLATSVTKNQSRVQNLKDSSILPDLCTSHIKQLSVMAENHKALIDTCDKCTKAKEELSRNVSSRLSWVTFTQNSMQKIGDQIDVFSENIARLKYQLGILEQVDMAPAAYFSCVAEIVRRRSFSQAFLVWASELACRLLTIHNEEVAKRKDFQSKFEDHFILALFPGMEDLPPGYGIQAPPYFDTGLPKLTHEDVDFLKKELPEMAEYLNIPDSTEPPPLLLLKSILNTESDKLEEQLDADDMLKQDDDQSEMADNVDKLISKEQGRESSIINPHGLPHLKDFDKGCESETDTEEFEKVGQSPMDLNFDKDIPSPRRGTQDASTLTEDNLEYSKTEYDKLKSLLFKTASIASQTIIQLKSELADFKLQHTSDRGALLQYITQLGVSYENLISEQENREKIMIQRLTTDHANEISDFRKLAQVKNEEIKSLRTNNIFLENKVKRMSEELSKLKEDSDRNDQERFELNKRVSFLELEKDKCVKEATEKLNREYRDQIKTLQARFKLMTMERTPSESSLEKTLEFSSLTNHESIINQMTENFELEKEKAVNETVTKETEKWENVIGKLKEDFELEKDYIISTLTSKSHDEKDKQIDLLRNREQVLLEEIKHYTTTIDKLAKADDDRNMDMMDKIEALENEKDLLNLELQRMRVVHADMTASVGTFSEGISIFSFLLLS
ncbi:hypothetical protein HHI36_005010 [Cryptolaemus montrouzieri]|uniref:RB1-inducible coiled-coil protein 1 n=1 Tax=Cryptolaemus montrouzieri TaxID=559131 RepID=A0ABD2NUG7_9CUCU